MVLGTERPQNMICSLWLNSSKRLRIGNELRAAVHANRDETFRDAATHQALQLPFYLTLRQPQKMRFPAHSHRDGHIRESVHIAQPNGLFKQLASVHRT